MDPTKKRHPNNATVSDNFSTKKPKPVTEPDNYPDFLNNDVLTDLSTSDLEELSKLLSAVSPPCPVKFVAFPYNVSPPVEHSTSYVTINGNEETCGSSFSDTDSSVMVSFDTACVNVGYSFGFFKTGSGGAWGEVGDVARGNEGSMGEWDWTEMLFDEDLEKLIS